uniref:Uncharacterized protein n=1 Tax=Timema cristinae TaxID=61476 RepID=A0A7R9H321_TIMCR|nr:unnamed protein product [Timema cristinae]
MFLIIWKQLLQEVFQDVNVSVTYQEKILVKEVDYLFELVKLLDRTPPRVLGNFLVWCVVRKLSRDSNQRMRELGFQMDRVISGLQEDLPRSPDDYSWGIEGLLRTYLGSLRVFKGLLLGHSRWRDCAMLTSTSLSFAVGYKYVSRHFDNRAKKSALQMLNNIREAFMRQVDRLEWMDTATRQVAQDKARLMTELVGYPDWFTNKTAFLEFHAGIRVGKNHLQNVVNLERLAMHQMLSKLHQPVERKDVDLYVFVLDRESSNTNLPIQLVSVFPAAVLQPPFFKKGRLDLINMVCHNVARFYRALNYGSIGVVIGHEITHGFDDMGRQTDKYGNLAQWWTSSTTDTYLKKAQCFIDQYNSYRVPELDSMVRREVKMNGVITQGENMADLGGLRQAYLAYKTLVRETGVEPRLPGLQEYSPEQLFFIGFGMVRNTAGGFTSHPSPCCEGWYVTRQEDSPHTPAPAVWCESTTKESLLQEVLSDPHSPHRLRVYGTLSNSPEFSQVWGCPSGSPMNPRHKCDLW